MSAAQPLASASARRDAFAPYSLDTLVSGAARLRPESIAFADRAVAAPFGIVAAQAAALARIFADCGLKPGERILLAGGAEVSLVIATLAALRGGFVPALAALDLDPRALSAYAEAIDAAALISPTDYGDLAPIDACFATAAAVPSIRLLATFGPGERDGAADLRADAILRYAASHPDAGLDRGKPAPAEPPPVITYDKRRARPVMHQQATLIAAALDFVARAKIGRGTPILSTLPPTSFAGLVAGPCAALLSGATLYLHGPFAADDLVKTRDEAGHAHLVAPVALAPEFVKAGLFDGLAAAVLVSRMTSSVGYVAPAPLAAPCPLVDLYAVDETSVIAEARRTDVAVPPAAEPHFIGFDESRTLTVEKALDAIGALAFKGAAVTAAN